jgi:hypothetical protein
MNMLFKNFLFYGLSNFANPWVADAGPKQIMYVFGGTSLFLSLLAIPVCQILIRILRIKTHHFTSQVYIYGKRLRSWWTRHDLFVILKMQTTGPKLDMA